MAGIVERTPTNNWTAYDTHVAGTRNVCDAMLQLGTRRCVMVSTSGTIAVSSEPVVHTEDFQLQADRGQGLALLPKQDLPGKTGPLVLQA